MNSKTLILLTTLAAMTAACSQDTVLSDVPQPLSVTTDGGQQQVTEPQADADELSLECTVGGADTRTGTGVQTSTFSVGDEVHVWLSNIKTRPAGGGDAINVTSATEYTCTVGSNGATLTLPADKTYTYMGAGSYPTAYGIKPKPASTKFSVQTDQKTEASYLESDLVYSEKKTYQQSSGTVKMQFNHLLSKIVVVLQARDEGITAADLAAATVKVNARTTCTFDYPTQSYVSPDHIDASVAATDITLSPQGACIIPPQGIAQDTPFIKISVNGKDREPLKIPTGGKTFEGGKQYTYTVFVYDNVWEVELAGVTVSDWGEAVTLTQGSDYYGDGNL